MKLKTRFMMLMLAILFSFSLSVWLYSEHLMSHINEQWAEQLAEHQVKFDKHRTLAPIIREVNLALKLAVEPDIINMALHEDDVEVKNRALKVLEQYRTNFRDHSYFAAFSRSGNYYANDAENQYHSKEFRYTLSKDKPSDRWFFATLENNKDYDINVNEDAELGVTKVWINVLIRHNSKVLGVIGTGIDISEFLNSAVDTVHPGIYNLFVNRDLAIQIHPDRELINLGSSFKKDEENIKLDVLFKNSADIEHIRQSILKLEKGNAATDMLWVDLNGEKQLLGIAYLPEIGWFDLTIMNTKNLTLLGVLNIFPFLLALFFLIALLIVWVVLNHWIFAPLAKLQGAMGDIAQGDLGVSSPLVGTGEILQLSNQFRRMCEFVRETNVGLEEQVRLRTTLLQTILDNAPLGIWMVDATGKIKFVNKTFCNDIGISESMFLQAEHYSEVLPFLNSASYLRTDKQCFEQAAGHHISTERIPFVDGKEHLLEIIKAQVVDQSGRAEGIICLCVDVTEQKKLEEQLIQSQKMEAIGTLVGGIAHDFNNTLAAMKGNLYLAKKHSDQKIVVDTKLDNIEKLSARAAKMVKQLLTFARKDMVSRQQFSLNSLLKEEFQLSKIIVPENIDCSIEVCDEELLIVGDVTQLQQALINLLNNAMDAVRDSKKPKIIFTLDAFDIDADFRKKHPEAKGEKLAHLTIEDNGSGISINNLEHIYEPFFTTKGVGEGTGLGLSMVYGSLQRHGGIIEVTSLEGEGTSFHIYIPLAERDENFLGFESGQETIVQGEGETILLIDDEQSVRETTGEVLSSMGYNVLLASDGQEGLKIFNANHSGVDVIISDVVMPEMGGVELAKSVHSIKQDLPIILATGYDHEQKLNTVEDSLHTIIIHKPFSFEKLSKLLRTLLKPRSEH